MRLDKAEQRLAKAAERLAGLAGGIIDVAVIVGSGLSEAFAERTSLRSLPYERLPASPHATLQGHPGRALGGSWAGKRVALFSGRVHLYQGFSPNEVSYFVQLAAAAGAQTLIATNAAGGLNPALAVGDLMLIEDQINLTGMAPMVSLSAEPFVDMVEAYDARLRARVHELEPSVRDGIFAGVRGPYYETPAEARALRTLGADAVGMSTVLETLAARALGLQVVGFSLIANAIGPDAHVRHADVLGTGRAGAQRLADVVERLIATL
ncbi:MAG: purine-nucleoside phosphorylase [Candidatus Eremiobacteraeota bacterium]|nr:purine-nucleoside phosphorylase [Candidatus Eremiobacteraeota bacterium]